MRISFLGLPPLPPDEDDDEEADFFRPKIRPRKEFFRSNFFGGLGVFPSATTVSGTRVSFSPAASRATSVSFLEMRSEPPFAIFRMDFLDTRRDWLRSSVACCCCCCSREESGELALLLLLLFRSAAPLCFSDVSC